MKKIFLAIILFVTNGNLYAQGVKMRDVFSQMPDTLLPYLSQNNKLDMMDFMESGMTADIVNGFDEHTCMTTLTDDYIRISLSPASSIEMKLLSTDKMLPDSADCILCMVRTVGTVQKSSTVRFYTSKWTEIKQYQIRWQVMQRAPLSILIRWTLMSLKS